MLSVIKQCYVLSVATVRPGYSIAFGKELFFIKVSSKELRSKKINIKKR